MSSLVSRIARLEAMLEEQRVKIVVTIPDWLRPRRSQASTSEGSVTPADSKDSATSSTEKQG